MRGGGVEEIGGIFNAWSADPALAGALIGFCVLDEEGRVVYASPLAEKGLCPASALKTVTTAAALEELGPDFRFTTTLVSDRTAFSEGVLDGNLVLVGSGDPTLSGDDLELMVDQLIAAGLTQINGKLRIDTSAFQEPAVSDHWNWGDIGNGYGAGAYAINVDHNRIAIRFQAGAKEGDPARLLNREGSAGEVRWTNHVTTGPAGSGDRVMVYSEPEGRTVTLRGSVPAGADAFTVSGAVPDPPARAAEILRAAFDKKGIRCLGRDMPEGPGGVPLASHQSARLAEIIDHLHKVSDNLEAQSLFLTLGAKAGMDPATAVRKHWEARGLPFSGLRLIDGSGLARANMIRPLDLARVNHAARHGKHGERFRESLSRYLDGAVRAKLGAMSGVKTEVGFLEMPDGRELTFALMANGLALDIDYWSLRDKLLSELRDAG
nr:D-alanyl-D-alanine carboxypeptidase/D-alanyl-D-alanine-endopeptidase [Luteolibacter marinus]